MPQSTTPATGELLPQGDTRLYKPRKKELRRRKRLEAIAELDMEIQEKASAIVAAYAASAEIDENTPRPPGWTDKQYRVAMDGRQPIKQQPGYLAAMVRLKESYQRAAASQPPTSVQPLAVDVKVYVKQENYNYEMIEVDEKGHR